MTDLNPLTGLPSISNNAQGLSKTFQNTIDYVMSIEEQPLLRIQNERDALAKRQEAYSEISSLLTSLRDSARTLYGGSGFSTLSYSRTATVTPMSADMTVATVVPGSGAVTGDYDLDVTTLAVAERHVSNVFDSATEALGESGTIWLGGTGTASAAISSDTSSVLTSVSTGSAASGNIELGKGDYTIETRNEGGTLQFRIKDADGNVVAIDDKNGELTTDWVSFTAGESYDTQRGLTFELSGSVGNDATVAYTAKGTSITVGTADSLVDIANDVNSTEQPEGREVVATVVGTQLVFSSQKTGTNHAIELGVTYSEDLAGLTFSDVGAGSQSAGNASFTVNGIAFSHQSNESLTDVIAGLTISLEADAEGNSATIEVSTDIEGARTSIEGFIENFNSTLDYMEEQTELKVNADNTYTRAILSTDSVFTDLRSKLFTLTLGVYSNAGDFSNLSEIGLTLDDDLRLQISDSDKLEEALSSKYDDVVSLLDGVMESFDATLTDYVGSDGYMISAENNMQTQFLDLSEDISDYQLRLIDRKLSLESQYADMQAQLLELQYTFQAWQGIYGNTQSFLG